MYAIRSLVISGLNVKFISISLKKPSRVMLISLFVLSKSGVDPGFFLGGDAPPGIDVV